ncbi:MAG: DUF3667 domain-containing protein [Polaribacter sp.]|nr:DUF3667 domain-containing protein [Polaribacter sp.]MDG1810596.1 DUF3667 domain-containing protein [Polaribacter sp.]MDG1994137.1 DUF3667 domain-containing protein [Polaribacter sp.]
MKLKKKKKSATVKVLNTACFNCGHPFYGNEKYCPECGQANKNKRITFGNFLHEVFNGFISWDSKFWTTFIPLIIKPGKVSRDYVEGKRQRYANPFRFYLSISVIFFLTLGFTDSYERFNDLKLGKNESEKSINQKIEDATKEIDSVNIKTDLKDVLIKTGAENKKQTKITSSKDSLKTKAAKSNRLKIYGFPDALKFYNFQKKNPTIKIENALDSLKVKHNFLNRFMYSRFQTLDNVLKSTENQKQFQNQLISYISISLFIFLPLFTLVLKLLYVRGKFTYVEHLVFVFHTQTVFFLLLTLFYLISFFSTNTFMKGVFLILFLVYLLMAMKRFYNQGYLKTFTKYILINLSFFFISLFGFIIVTLITFTFY